MPADVPIDAEVDYTAGSGQGPADYPTLDEKLEQAVEVSRTALEQYESPVVLWTGGKDSMLVLWVVREVCAEYDFDVPPVVFLDHYEHFEATHTFVEQWADRWELDFEIARNEDFATFEPGSEIPVANLSADTKRELRDRLGYDGDAFVFSADSYEGNHLLKTVPLNQVITDYGADAVFSGVRWDEQAARAEETFFSPRHDSEKYPPHDRVHPILPFDERAVWAATWEFLVPATLPEWPAGHVPEDTEDLPAGYTIADLPVSPKYFDGYRSLGTRDGSQTSGVEPAWQQDLDGTTERAGRAQDKEDLMERLRDLGYM